MSSALLLEIGTEDLPARYIGPLAEALSNGISGGLLRRGVECGAVRSFATPRRLAVLIDAVAEHQPPQMQERYGPATLAAFKDNNPTPAALGFAKSCGVAFSQIGQKDGKLHFCKTSPGKTTAELLPEVFEDTLKAMDVLVPKRMRWGSGNETFVRPVSWLTCLLGEQIVALHRFYLHADRISYGHRFHAPAALTLTTATDYPAAMQDAHVWADVPSRKDEVRRQIEAEAKILGGHVRITEDLLDEVTALLEWPVAITGGIEARFLELPPEVIVATVETNQRYFTVFADAQHTQLLPFFITVSNIHSRDVAQVIQGNERVVRPRLSDAMFFWREDLKQPLGSYFEKLRTVTFQKDLGSTADKVQRTSVLAAHIAPLCGVDSLAAARAMELAKCDLNTRMVFEFPELQGIMGGYYAEKSGEDASTVRAIAEHYRPTQSGAPIPSNGLGHVLALADKLDTLAGIFAAGQKPSASKDPYGLRRAALGVLRILIEGGYRLDLQGLLHAALSAQPVGNRDAALLSELIEFVMERLRSYATTDGVSTAMFEAVKALASTQPLDFMERLRAVEQFTAMPEAADLAAAHKRVRNILKQAGSVASRVDPAHFADPAEAELYQALQTIADQNQATSDYQEQLVNLAQLRTPVDHFFARVMVNADDAQVRNNRLALLAELDQRCRSVADLSLLPG